MEKKYELPVCIDCGGRLDLTSYYDKIMCHINKNGVVEFEQQNNEVPDLNCTKCGKKHDYYFDEMDRINLELEEN